MNVVGGLIRYGAGMQRWSGRVALVTGASGGIGQAIARALVSHGMTVIGCAIDFQTTQIEDGTQSSNGSPGSLHTIKCDLTREEEILAMFAQIKQKFGGVDVCINNAGVNHAKIIGPESLGILNGETDKWKNMLDVNVLAPAICTREAVKQMEEKGTNDGQIIMTCSLGGHRVNKEKDFHFYCVSKFGVAAMVEGIRMELRERKSKIRIAAISPGMVQTGFREHTYPEEDLEKTREAYRQLEKPLQADDIADCAMYILQAPPHVQVHDIQVRPVTQEN